MKLTSITERIPHWLQDLDYGFVKELFPIDDFEGRVQAIGITASLRSRRWKDNGFCETVEKRFGLDREADVGVGLFLEDEFKAMEHSFGGFSDGILRSVPESEQIDCICRTLVPSDYDIENDFRIEVITTPDDMYVISWAFYVG
jgi:hypothetical protein